MTSFGRGCLFLQLLVTVVSALTSTLFRKVNIFDLRNQRNVVALDTHSSKLMCLAVLASRQHHITNNQSVDTMGAAILEANVCQTGVLIAAENKSDETDERLSLIHI